MSEMAEIRCSSKKDAKFYAKAGTEMLLGRTANDETVQKDPLDSIVLTGLGSAVSICVCAADIIVKTGVAKMGKIETSFVNVESSRGVACVRITLRADREKSSERGRRI